MDPNAPRPAIPSRAASSAVPQTAPPLFELPIAELPPTQEVAAPRKVGKHPALGMPYGKKKAAKKKAVPKSKKLSPAEVRKLNAKRERALRRANLKTAIADAKKKTRKRRKPIRDKHAINGTPAKNPNRPLEMKNQLQAVLAMTGQLKKPELVIFSQIVAVLQNVPRGSRKKIIVGLAQVYP